MFAMPDYLVGVNLTVHAIGSNDSEQRAVIL